MSTILVTGGAGFIGSHTCVELLNAGYNVVVLDNLVNSSRESLNRVEKITGKAPKFYEGDMLDRAILDKIFTENDIFAVIHFAGLKAVGESVHKPQEYYWNNITGTLTLTDEMRKHNVKHHFLIKCHSIRKSCRDPYYRELPEGDLHKSLWLDKVNA